jgi:DNA-binding transcriptional ArsR family regulator
MGVEGRLASGDLFPTDQPLPASQMIGRRDDVAEIVAALENGTNLILAGPRRTGKTSVAQAALTQLAAAGLYVAEVDLFNLADAAELAEALATAVLSNRPAIKRMLPRARRFGRQALSAAQGALAMRLTTQLGDAVEIALTPGLAASDPERALGAALELPERIALADGTRIVLFFDEFQELAGPRRPYGDPDAITKRMRAVLQRSPNVSVLFSGSLEHVMRDLFAPQRRAFSGFGSFHRLRAIEPADWAQGLAERFGADRCTVTDGALESIIAHGELHPRVTMLIAQQTHLLSVLTDRRQIDAPLAEEGYERAYRGDRALLDQLQEQLRTTHREALKLARRIAARQTLTSGIRPAEADRALKRLADAGFIERVGRGNYTLTNPLLRRRLLERQPPAFKINAAGHTPAHR